MRAVVDGRPADIEAHLLGIERFEGLLAAGQRVVKRQRHDYGLADCAPPVHAIERPEPPPNLLSGTIKTCIDYYAPPYLQRGLSEKSNNANGTVVLFRTPAEV